MSKIPDTVSREFLEDVVCFANTFYDGAVPCYNRGVEHQKEMKAKYPKEWMEWVFNEIGYFNEDW